MERMKTAGPPRWPASQGHVRGAEHDVRVLGDPGTHPGTLRRRREVVGFGKGHESARLTSSLGCWWLLPRLPSGGHTSGRKAPYDESGDTGSRTGRVYLGSQVFICGLVTHFVRLLMKRRDHSPGRNTRADPRKDRS